MKAVAPTPPTIDKLQKIREALKLSDLEYIQILQAAFDGRISEEDRKILNELTYYKQKFNNTAGHSVKLQ